MMIIVVVIQTRYDFPTFVIPTGYDPTATYGPFSCEFWGKKVSIIYCFHDNKLLCAYVFLFLLVTFQSSCLCECMHVQYFLKFRHPYAICE